MFPQEIGLKGLTTISRGSVRIEKNPLLCFVDTIDWTYIANGTTSEDHFFNSNRSPNECSVCSTAKKSDGDANSSNGGEIECPASKHDSKKKYCWNRHTCQKSECRACKCPIVHGIPKNKIFPIYVP